MKEKRYNEAVAAYKKIAADSPRSALAADALYEIALVHLFHDNPRKEYAQAIRTFEEFLKLHPDNKRAPEAQNWIYILRTIQELKKNNEQLNMSIEQLNSLFGKDSAKLKEIYCSEIISSICGETSCNDHGFLRSSEVLPCLERKFSKTECP